MILEIIIIKIIIYMINKIIYIKLNLNFLIGSQIYLIYYINN